MLVIELNWRNRDGMRKTLKLRIRWPKLRVTHLNRQEGLRNSGGHRHDPLLLIQVKDVSPLPKAAAVHGLSGMDGGTRGLPHHHHPNGGGNEREETPCQHFINDKSTVERKLCRRRSHFFAGIFPVGLKTMTDY